MECDPILDMRVSQEQLRVMFERNKQLAQLNPAFHAGYAESTTFSPEDWHLTVTVPVTKPNKYRNVKVEFNGMMFDSGHELECWKNLKLREQAGEITHLERQSSFDLNAMGGEKVGKFTPDFTWYENGQTIVADAKSKITRKETAYRMRKRHFEAQYAPLVIREL